MKKLLEAAGRGFLLAFGAAALTYAAGILEAPNLSDAVALGVAALGASFSAGLTALKEWVPQFSWATILPFPPAWISRLDVFTIAAVGTLIVSLTDIINQAPDLTLWPALVTAAITGALAAGFRTVVGAATKGETGLGIGANKGIGPAVAPSFPGE